MILDPIHYLATLGKKPGALDHSPVFRDWKLPVGWIVLSEPVGGRSDSMKSGDPSPFASMNPLLRALPHSARSPSSTTRIPMSSLSVCPRVVSVVAIPGTLRSRPLDGIRVFCDDMPWNAMSCHTAGTVRHSGGGTMLVGGRRFRLRWRQSWTLPEET